MNLPLIFLVSKAANGELPEPRVGSGKMPLWEKIGFAVIAALIVAAITVVAVLE